MRGTGSRHPARRRAVVAAGCTVGALLATTGAAAAAGTGYGGGAPAPVNAPGFSSVATASTVKPSFVGAVKGTEGTTSVHVKVVKGDLAHPTQIVIIKGDDTTVSKDLVPRLKHDRPVFSFGVLLRHGSSPATTREKLKVVVRNSAFPAGDILVEYRHGRFRQIGRIANRGRFHVFLTSGAQFAVLAPPKGKHPHKR